MQGYEITERGKIAIAVVIAILMISLAVILAARFLNGSSSPFDNQQQPAVPEQVYNPSDISNTPPPNDGDTEPVDNQEDEHGEHGSFDPPQEPDDEPSDGPSQEEPGDEPEDSSDDEPSQEQGAPGGQPATGATAVNISAGTMSFRFSPSSQDSLDADTVAKIGDFLKSPKNTANSQIVVSMPQLPEADTAKIISAVTEAFADKGVEQRNLAFTIYRTGSGNNSYEIRLSFSQATTRK